LQMMDSIFYGFFMNGLCHFKLNWASYITIMTYKNAAKLRFHVLL